MFAITATTGDADDIFGRMRDAVKIITDTYGINKLRYSVIVYGAIPRRYFDFTSIFSTRESLKYVIDRLQKTSGRPDTKKALEEAMKVIEDSVVRPAAKTVIVLITDGALPDKPQEVERFIEAIEKQGIPVLTFALVNNPQTDYEAPINVESKELAKKVMKNVLAGKYISLSILFAMHTTVVLLLCLVRKLFFFFL